MSIRTVIRWILVVALAGMFIFAGLNKVTDKVNPDIHQEMIKASSTFTKVGTRAMQWAAEWADLSDADPLGAFLFLFLSFV